MAKHLSEYIYGKTLSTNIGCLITTINKTKHSFFQSSLAIFRKNTGDLKSEWTSFQIRMDRNKLDNES